MFILALIAIAILLAVFYQIIGILIGTRTQEQSLLEMECEMIALDAECARAVQGSAEESSTLKQAS
jgi:hypothetical protein